MDKIEKFLQKLNPKQRLVLLKIIESILIGDTDGLDIKKLSGESNLYRVRKGKIRIIYKKDGEFSCIVNIDFRGDIYKDL